jgi:hypothetical protein
MEAFRRVAPPVAAALAGEDLAADREQYRRLVQEKLEEMQKELRELEEIRDFGFPLGDEDEDEP